MHSPSDTARQLAANHKLHVFPVNADKTPATAHGFKDSSNDPDVVASLFKRGERVGLWPGPSGLVVVDIDVKDGADGESEWFDLVSDHSQDRFPPEVLTPSGGKHLYFRKPPGLVFDNTKLSASIDIRSDTGYVLVPSAGSGYEWELGWDGEWCADCEPSHPMLGDAPQFPEYLVRVLRESKVRVAEPTPDDEPIPAGARYDTLFRLGRKMRFNGMPESAVREALLATNRERCQPPHPDSHVLKIVKGVMNPNDPPVNPETGEVRSSEAIRVRHRHQEEQVAPLNWVETFAKPTERVSWLPGLEGLAIEGRITNLYGPAGTGKSELMLHRAAEAAKLGVKVLWLDREMTEEDAKERLEDMAFSPHDLSNLVYYLYPPLPFLDTPDGGEALVEMALLHQVDLVVLDSLSKFVKGDEQDSSTATNFYVWSMLALKEEGIASVTIDHTGKDVTRGARGTSAKKDNVDLYMEITRIGGVGARLTTGKQRHSWVRPSYTYRRFTNPIGYALNTLCTFCGKPAVGKRGDYFVCEGCRDRENLVYSETQDQETSSTKEVK